MANLHDPCGRRRTPAPARLLLKALANAPAALQEAEWSHHCSACGKCCNSPPQLSVPELFHHQATFFGCLMVQRVPHHASSEGLAAQLLHRAPGAESEADYFLLATQAFDLGLSERCPALDAEQRCSVQDLGKPAICRVVPFDALVPDRQQHLVLATRASEARYVGSDCIAPGVRPGFALVTRRLQVVEHGARAALAERRQDLAADARFWGRNVFKRLIQELPCARSGPLSLPANGFITLSLAPVLMALADASARCRARCLTYLDAQLSLAVRMLSQAQAQGHSEREAVQRLAAFSRTNARLRGALAAGLPTQATLSGAERAAVEAWLTV